VHIIDAYNSDAIFDRDCVIEQSQKNARIAPYELTLEIPSLYIRADLSTHRTSKVLILNVGSTSCELSTSWEGAWLEVTALELLAVAVFACCGAGTKDIH
jgi:hypothetical protein